MTRALGMVSGGIDSTLAVMTLMRQGIEVTGISFATPFLVRRRQKLQLKRSAIL